MEEEDGAAVDLDSSLGEHSGDDTLKGKTSSKKEWSKDETSKLIKIFGQKEIQLKFKSLCGANGDAYIDISKQLKGMNIKYSPSSCKAKIANLHRSYVKALINRKFKSKFKYFAQIHRILKGKTDVVTGDAEGKVKNSSEFHSDFQKVANHAKLTGPFPYLAPLSIKTTLEDMTQKLASLEEEAIADVAVLENSFKKYLKEKEEKYDADRRRSYQELIHVLNDAGFKVS